MAEHRNGNLTSSSQPDIKTEPGESSTSSDSQDASSKSPKSRCIWCNFSTTDSWTFVQHMREHDKMHEPAADSQPTGVVMAGSDGGEPSSDESNSHPARDDSSRSASIGGTDSGNTRATDGDMTSPSQSPTPAATASSSMDSSPAIQSPPAITIKPIESPCGDEVAISIKREVVTPSPPSSATPDAQPPSIPHLAAMIKTDSTSDLPSTSSETEDVSEASPVRPEGLYINTNTPWYPNPAAYANPYTAFYPNHYPMPFPPDLAMNPAMNPAMFYPGATMPPYPYGMMYPGADPNATVRKTPPENPVPETQSAAPAKKKTEPNTRVEDKMQFMCHLCARNLTGRPAYETHISYHRRKHFHCPVCRCLYWTSSLVFDHWKRNCMKAAPEKANPKMIKYPCETCEEKLESIYGIHERPSEHVPEGFATVEKLYFCESCPRVLSTESRFEEHRNTHKYNKSNQCPRCKFTYATKNLLKSHMSRTCFKSGETEGDTEVMMIDEDTQSSRGTPRPTRAAKPESFVEDKDEDLLSEMNDDDNIGEALSDGSEKTEPLEEADQSLNDHEECTKGSIVDIKEEVKSETDGGESESLNQDNEEVSETEKKFTCHLCPQAHLVSRREHFDRHLTALRKKHYHCRTCLRIFKFSTECVEHMKTACRSDDPEDGRDMLPAILKKYPCITCENDLDRFYGLGAVADPVPEWMMEPTKKGSDVEILFCMQCPEIHTLRSKFENHTEKHQDDGKQFHCADCNKSFAKKSKLQEHLKTVCLRQLWESRDSLKPGEESQALSVFGNVCEVCNKIFPTAKKLTTHMDTHKTSFECPRCGAILSRKDHLAIHMKSERCKTLQSQRYNPDEDTELPLVIPIYRCLKCRVILRSVEEYNAHRCSGFYLDHSFDRLANAEEGSEVPPPQPSGSIKDDFSMATQYVQHPNDSEGDDESGDKSTKKLDLTPISSLSYQDQIKHMIEQVQMGNVGFPDQEASLYPCPCCDRMFETYSGMLEHYKCHKQFTVCKWCGRDFDERPRMLNHQQNCFLKDRAQKSLEDKAKIVFPYKGLPCKNCGNVYHTTRGFRLHRCNYSMSGPKVKDGQNEQAAGAEVDKTMPMETDETAATGDAQGASVKTPAGKSTTPPTAPFERNPVGYISPRHWPKCDVCRKKFQFKSQLADHLAFFEKPTDVTCIICHKVFDDPATQYKHTKRNHKEGLENTSLSCPICQNTYSRFDHLNTHIFDKNSRCKLINKLICCMVCGKDTELLFTDLYYHIRFCDNLPARKAWKRKKGIPIRPQDENSQMSDPPEGSEPGSIESDLGPKSTQPKSENGDTESTAGDATSSEPPAKKSLKCDVTGCGETFQSPVKLEGHMRRFHTNPYTCEYCHRKYTTKESLKHHVTTHTKEHKCRVCGKYFSSIYVLKKHSYLHTGERPYECSLCPMKFSAPYDLNAHVKIHNTDTPFLCKPCGLAYPTLRLLTYHKNEAKCHSNDVFHCDQCEAKFRTHLQLTRHLLEHREERPYKCRVCQKGFKQLATLYSHKKVHMVKEKKFICELCGAAFRDKSALTVHIRRHTGETLFTCEKCGKGFATRNTYFQHLRVHDKKYKCPQCNRMFSEKGYMNRHIKQTHMK